MMFLMNGIRAEVEPVPGRKGWFQLTGKHIERWTVDVSDTFGDLENADITVNYVAKIWGIHSEDDEIALKDPRFNHENDSENGEASFGVYTELGRMFMLLAVNQAEYAIFRFLIPHETGDDGCDPIEDYRVEAKPAKPVSKAVPAKKAKAKA